MRGIHKYASKGDLIIASDVDEIINPEIFNNIKLNQSPLSAELDLYYYYLNMKVNKKGLGPVIGSYGSFRGIEQLRLTVQDNKIVSNAGWHFTFMGGAEKIINKLNAYSESQTNRTILNDQLSINYIINNRIDLFNRDGYEYKIVDIDESYPKNIQNFIDKYPNYIYDSSNMTHQPNHSVAHPMNNINEDLTKRHLISKVLKRLYKIYWKYIK
jgi:beta-1,4-mannosyl-glycoprotein beta-1,4-N-acetylglucosaminyltransferase